MPLSHLLGCGLVGEIAVPSATKVAVTPSPLLLAWRVVVTGHMQHATLGIVLVTTLEVKARVYTHIAGGYEDIFIVRDIDTSRIVHLIIGACGDGEAAYGTLSMIEHGIDIGWEHTLVGIVNLNGWVGPPQECLRQIGAIADATLNFEISTTRAQGKACHTLLVEHALHLVYPYGDRAILVLNNGAINGHVGGWTMVLGPVKLDTTANPRTS